MKWIKNWLGISSLEDTVVAQNSLIQELISRHDASDKELNVICDSYNKQFEEIRIRLSKPDKSASETVIGRASNWREDRRKLEARFAAPGGSSDVIITPAGSR